MEVSLGREDDCPILRHALDLVGPFSRDLNCRLDSLDAGVHGKHHVVAERLVHLLGPLGKDIVVECA